MSSFLQLRDFVDVTLCREMGVFDQDVLSAEPRMRTKQELEAAKAVVKVTQGQVDKCYELLKFLTLDKTDEGSMKTFRLAVKRRLLARGTSSGLGEEFSEDKEQRKQQLACVYADIEEEYLALSRKLDRAP